MEQIVVLDGHTLNPGDLSWKSLEKLGKVTVYERTPETEVLTRAKDASIIITNKCPINNTIISNLPMLKHIAVSATGYNVVDIVAARQRGVSVSNVPGYGTSAVAQHVFAFILELSNSINVNTRSVANGKWAKHQDWCFWEAPIIELENKVIGIIGLGSIGSRVADLALAYGMKVIVNDRSPEKKQRAGLTFTDVNTLFEHADFISLHCPLTEANEGFVNKDLLSKMKKSAVLINTGRGGLINEKDVAQALLKKQIAAACLDVLSQEPPSENHPLVGLPNCLITPHNAWAAKEARERLLNILVKNIIGFLSDEPQNIVND